MKQLIQKYALRALLVAGLLTISAGGMMISAHLTKVHGPDVVQTVGAAACLSIQYRSFAVSSPIQNARPTETELTNNLPTIYHYFRRFLHGFVL